MGRKEQTVLIAIGANIILILLRFILAGISGSLGLKANAWHSLADVFVSGVVLLGLLVSHWEKPIFSRIITKLERIVALLVSLFIFYMGIELFLEAIRGEGIELKYLPIASLGAFFGVIICYFMARYKIYVGTQTNSPSLVADGYHSKMDMYCSLAVLVGLLGALFGMATLDKVAAMVVVVFIFLTAYEIFISNLKALLAKEALNQSLAHLHLEPIKMPKAVFGISIFSLFIAGYIFSGVYYVRWDEQGIVRRFGKVLKANVPSGLHYRLPYPIERVDMVKVDNIQRIETSQNLLLTGDTNLLNVNVAVHYKVSNAVQYLIKTKNPTELITNVVSSSIRKFVGEKGIDYILTTGKSEIEEAAKELSQQILEGNKSGIKIINVQLLQVTPPEDVIAAFQDVASAREDKVTYVNEAQSYYNTLVPEARGNAFKAIKEAEGYKAEKISFAKGEAGRFLEKLKEYEKAEAITQKRLYLETMEKVLPKAKKFLTGQNIETAGTDIWLLDDKTSKTGISLGGER